MTDKKLVRKKKITKVKEVIKEKKKKSSIGKSSVTSHRQYR